MYTKLFLRISFFFFLVSQENLALVKLELRTKKVVGIIFPPAFSETSLTARIPYFITFFLGNTSIRGDHEQGLGLRFIKF